MQLKTSRRPGQGPRAAVLQRTSAGTQRTAACRGWVNRSRIRRDDKAPHRRAEMQPLLLMDITSSGCSLLGRRGGPARGLMPNTPVKFNLPPPPIIMLLTTDLASYLGELWCSIVMLRRT